MDNVGASPPREVEIKEPRPCQETRPNVSARQIEHSATRPTKQGKAKWQRVLEAFIDRGAQGLNRFQAARELSDHVLPTTVSQLERRGVRILRRTETVPGFMGSPTDCARYWLDPAAVQRAHELLGLPRTPSSSNGSGIAT